MSSLARNRGTISKLLYYSVFCVVAVFAFLDRFDNFKYLDVDLMWHIRVGEEIVQNHSISFANTFSWLEGTLWTQQEWLFDVLIYLVSRFFGVFGFVFIGMLVFGSSYAIPYFCNKWKYKFLSLAVFYYLFVDFKVNSINRPMWFSVYFVLLLMYLYDSERLSKVWKLALYFLLGVFSANFHAGMIVVMFVLLALNIVFDVFFNFKFKKAVEKKNILFLLGDIAVFLLGYMVNPLGPKRYIEMFKVSSLATTAYISEWRPLTIPGALGAFILVAVIFVTGYGFLTAYRKKDEKECRRLIVVAAFVCLGIMSQKSGIVGLLFFMTYAYKYLEIMIDDILISGTVIERAVTSFYGSIEFKKEWLSFVTVAVTACLIALPLCMRLNTFDDYIKHGLAPSAFVDKTKKDEVLLQDVVSQDIMDYLKTASAEDEDFSIVHSYSMGNFLVWEKIPAFVDSRQFPYADGATEVNCTALDDLLFLTNGTQEEYQSFFDEYRFKYVLVGDSAVVYSDKLNKSVALCENYELIMSDERSGCSLYQRIEG